MPLIDVDPLTSHHYYPGQPRKKLSFKDSHLPDPTSKLRADGLTIIVDGQPEYATDDAIRGHVELHCPQQRNISAIRLSLICQARMGGSIWTGWSDNETRQKVYYYRTGYLTYYNEHRELTESRETYQAGTYKWPFIFKVPPKCNQLCEPNMRDPQGFAVSKKYSLFRGAACVKSPPFPMPGTFYCKNDKGAAVIEYVIKAQAHEFEGLAPDLLTKSLISLYPISVRQVNTLQPTADLLADESASVKQYLQMLLRKEKESSFAFMLRKAYFNSAISQPYTGFSMSFDFLFMYPKRLEVLNSQTPISLMMKVTPSKESYPLWKDESQIPSLQLVWAEVTLGTLNSWRPDGGELNFHRYQSGLSNPSRQTLGLIAQWQGEERDVCWEVDLGCLLNLSIVQNETWNKGFSCHRAPYTFTSSTVSRSYYLLWKLCFRNEDGERLLLSHESGGLTPWITLVSPSSLMGSMGGTTTTRLENDTPDIVSIELFDGIQTSDHQTLQFEAVKAPFDVTCGLILNSVRTNHKGWSNTKTWEERMNQYILKEVDFSSTVSVLGITLQRTVSPACIRQSVDTSFTYHEYEVDFFSVDGSS